MSTFIRKTAITTYVESGNTSRAPYEFVMDARTQDKIVPKAAPRGSESFGFKTMNEGGKPAGKVYGKL
jgi:hypothetical protein